MTGIALNVSLENLAELRRALDPAKVDRALARAMKAASAKEATAISKDVRAVYNIKHGDIKKTLDIRRLPGAQPDYLLLYVSGVAGLDKFGMTRKKVKTPRGRAVGASVRVKKTSGRKVVKGGFIQSIHGDKIFKRVGEARLPIKRLFGPSVPAMVLRTLSRVDFERRAAANVATEFERQIRLLLDK
jgi:hypothetical protein